MLFSLTQLGHQYLQTPIRLKFSTSTLWQHEAGNRIEPTVRPGFYLGLSPWSAMWPGQACALTHTSANRHWLPAGLPWRELWCTMSYCAGKVVWKFRCYSTFCDCGHTWQMLSPSLSKPLMHTYTCLQSTYMCLALFHTHYAINPNSKRDVPLLWPLYRWREAGWRTSQGHLACM